MFSEFPVVQLQARDSTTFATFTLRYKVSPGDFLLLWVRLLPTKNQNIIPVTELPMPRLAHSVGVLCALALAGYTAASCAGPTEYSLELGLGAEYDSNVSIDELDASSSEGDYALTVDAELQIEKQLTQATDISLTYDFSDTSYKEFSRLDRQTHLLGGNLATDLGPATAGMSLYYINARLDGDAFLEYYRASPYISGFLAKKWFSRAAYVYSDKSIEQNPGRDSESHAGEFDLYYFRRGLRSYLNGGYRYKQENATSDQYDYAASEIKLRYIHRWDVYERALKFELAWRYEYRDYDSLTPSIEDERWDRRQRWKVGLEYALLAQAALELYGGYADYNSNYPSADYDQYVIGTRISYAW